MPSTVSSSVVMVLDSSTVITPSLPTFFMASAMMLPMVESPLAEIMPTCNHVARDRLREFLDLLDGQFDRFVDPAFQRHRVQTRRNGLDALAKNRLRRMVAVVVPS